MVGNLRRKSAVVTAPDPSFTGGCARQLTIVAVAQMSCSVAIGKV
jgi:hypothetical protein